MLHIKGKTPIFLALVALLADTEVFAKDFSMPYIPLPLGPPAAQSSRTNAQAQAERYDAFRHRNKKGVAAAGKEKSLLCAGCHGELGVSIDPLIPNLAGQYDNYIIKQVLNFQDGARSNGIMSAMASTINIDDLFDVAAYFSSQERMKSNGRAENQLGKELFSNSGISEMGLACVNCHGERGYGLEPRISAFPVIGGQQKEYIRQQLINFRAGDRTNTPNYIMNRMTISLTDAQIESLAEYLSRQ
jgi:cytochrome c553